jgi:uncharacterized membrane protein YuzA (DUF378 family)
MKLHKICHILLIIGGLNWLLIGLFNWGVADIVGMIIARIIYILVGLAAIYDLVTFGDCGRCQTKKITPVNPTV